MLLSSVENEASKLILAATSFNSNLDFSQQFGRLNRVPGTSLDNVGHCVALCWIPKVSNRVHSSVLEIFPNNILKANQIITQLANNLMSGPPEVVAFLGCRGIGRAKLVGRGVL